MSHKAVGQRVLEGSLHRHGCRAGTGCGELPRALCCRHRAEAEHDGVYRWRLRRVQCCQTFLCQQTPPPQSSH